MSIQRYQRLLDKSEASMISAIEIFNKPDFNFREESFAILALTAWELLLKAKILKENKNDLKSIYIYENRTNKDGSKSIKKYIKKNRVGNAQTFGIGRAIIILQSKLAVNLSTALKDNLDALMEIRDNSVHFMNASPNLSKQILEIGTATLKNYLTITEKWFKSNFSKYNLFLMPIGFLKDTSSATGIVIGGSEQNLMNYLTELTKKGEALSETEFHTSLTVNLSFQRSKVDSSIDVNITNDPNATKVFLSEKQIRENYPWDYKELSNRLSQRYIDFKINQKYHDLRKSIFYDQRYVNRRYLDPENPKSIKKDFFNSNILRFFDKHYTRK